MAQYAIVKQKTKHQSAKNYIARITSAETSLYFYFGNPVSWSVYPGGSSYSDTSPPVPFDTLYNEKQVWDGMIGLKQITAGDVKLGFNRVDWISGNYYDMYRDDYDGLTVNGVSLAGEYVNTKPLSLAKSNNLVLVNSSGTYRLYRCIDNRSATTGYPIPSTVQPSSISSSIQTLSDGYKWKYMGTLSTGDVSDYLTSTTTPMPSTASTTTAAGQVVSIVITSRGAGITTTPTVTFKGDGTGLVLGTPVLVGGGLAYIPITSAGSGYTYVNITVTGGTTQATAKAIIAPVGGFANDLVTEIEPNYMIVKALNVNTDSYFTARGNAPTVFSSTGVQNLTYRTVGLLENPTTTYTSPLPNFTEYRYNTMTGSLAYGDLLTTATSGLANPVATVVGIRQDTSTVADIVTINAATSVNGTSHVITAIGHLLNTGDTVLYSNGGGTTIGALTNNATYYVIKIDADNFKLATTLSNAQSNVALSITAGVGSSHTFTENVVKTYVSLLQTTEQLIEHGTLTTGNLLTKTDSSATIYLGPYVKFNGSSASVVGVGTDVLTIAAHPFATGDLVTYSNGGGTTISTTGSALIDGANYYVIRTTSNEIKLATSLANANNGISIDIIGVGSGTNHSLTYVDADASYLPEVTKYTGNIIFTEYRNAVTRSTSQEKFRFVLEF